MPLIENIDIPVFLAIFSLTLLLSYVFFKPLLFSLVDPIWFLVIINTTVTLTLVIYNKFVIGEIFSNTVLYVILCHIFFIFGARFTKLALIKNGASPFNLKKHGNMTDSQSAVWLLNISTVILLFVAIYYMVIGFPAFASDPELARVLSRRDGGGAITRVFNVFSYFSLTLWFYCRLKKIKLGFLTGSLGISLPIFLLISVGAKASLLMVYISLFYVSYYVSCEAGRKFTFSSKYFFVTVGIVLCVAFALLYARAEETGAATSSIEFASFQLLGRIIFSGIGADHYFSNLIPALDHLNIFDYIYQYILLPLLAPLRILAYEPTVGSILAVSMTGDDTFGPNPSMYVEGIIYFGPVFGVLYCGVLGVIFSGFRYYPLRLKQISSFFRVVVFSFSNMLIMSMTYDMILFVGDVVNSLLFLIPIFLIFLLIKKSIIKKYSKSDLEAEL